MGGWCPNEVGDRRWLTCQVRVRIREGLPRRINTIRGIRIKRESANRNCFGTKRRKVRINQEVSSGIGVCGKVGGLPLLSRSTSIKAVAWPDARATVPVMAEFRVI